MEATDKILLSLLLKQEAEISELKNYILQLQSTLQITQQEYDKLNRLYFLYKRRTRKAIRGNIGFKTKGGLK